MNQESHASFHEIWNKLKSSNSSKVSKNERGKFIPNFAHKHVITNCIVDVIHMSDIWSTKVAIYFYP